MTDRIILKTREDLQDNWRYQYDILVLPEQSPKIEGLGEGWVAPQSTLGGYGGISLDDLQKVRELPGVELAAPVSLIGYVPMDTIDGYYESAQFGDFFRVDHETRVYDGLSERITSNNRYFTQYNQYGEKEEDILSIAFAEEGGLKNFMPPGTTFRHPNEYMLIGVDPASEEGLYSLSNSLENGTDLQNVRLEYQLGDPIIPLIVLKDQKYQVSESLQVYKINLPSDVDEEAFLGGPRRYLANLPHEILVDLSIEPFSEEWRNQDIQLVLQGDSNFSFEEKSPSVGEMELYRYSPIQYTEADTIGGTIPTVHTKKVIGETNILHSGKSAGLLRYRAMEEIKETQPYGLRIIDLYDTDRLIPTYQDSWQPGDLLDLYTPHQAMIIGNGAGEPIDPTPLVPVPYKNTYYTGAPDAITTLDAAEFFYGDRPPISSIRVLVSGVDGRSAESQRKITETAERIMEATGHRAEIMLGSALGKVHVDLDADDASQPGLIEEAWRKSGVSWSIEEQVEESNLFLFGYLLIIGTVFCFTVIRHSLLRRVSEFAMLRSIGWPRKRIVWSLVLEAVLLTLLGTAVPVAVNAATREGPWQQLWPIPLILFALVGLGYAAGVRQSLGGTPRAGLEGEAGGTAAGGRVPIRSIPSYVVSQMLRRPARFGLLLLVMALTSFMSILFLATKQSLSDFLFLSFLGETIDLALEGYQMALLVTGMVLTAGVVLLLLWLNISERRSEFYILHAIGWPVRRIRNYLIAESAAIGLFGAGTGTLAAWLAVNALSDLSLPAWTYLAAFLIPALVLAVWPVPVLAALRGRGITKGKPAA